MMEQKLQNILHTNCQASTMSSKIDTIESPSSVTMLDSSTSLSLSGGQWPQSEKGWRNTWRSLSIHQPDFLNNPNPMEPNATGVRRMELWKRTLGSDVNSMNALLDKSQGGWDRDTSMYILRAPITLASVIWFGTIVIDFNKGNLAHGAVSGFLFLAFLSAIGAGLLSITRMKARQNYLSGIFRILNGPKAPERLAQTVRQAVKNGLCPTGELLAWADLVERQVPENFMRISIEDSLDLAELNDVMQNALKDMRPGAPLALKGENSELLHRAAASMGECDLDSLAEDIRNPKGKTL